MKSKILPSNPPQTNHASTNATNSSNRTRHPVKCPNGKYSSTLVSLKISESDKSNNNNNEEPDHDSDLSSGADVSMGTGGDSLNNNSISDGVNDKGCEPLLEVFHHINIEDTESQPVSRHVDPLTCDVDDVDSNNIYVENNDDTDEESRKSSSGSSVENRTNLIVNYLPQNMSQEEMKGLFSAVGVVESCKLIRDKTTGQSLSYGFVNYQNARDASVAIKQFNGMGLQNKIIKVSLARPSSETIKGANLYICGLPKSMTQLELEQLFSQYGTIITCRILVDNVTGNSKGVAFIRFDQRHEAETAIKNLNGNTPTNGTEPITVKLANTPFNINNSSNSQLLLSHNSQSNEYMTTSPNNTSSAMSAPGGVRCMVQNMRPITTTGSDIIPRLDVVLQNNGHPPNGVMGPDYVQSTGHAMSNNHQIPYPTGPLICPPQMHSIATFPMSYPAIQHPCLQSMPSTQGPAQIQTNSHLPMNVTHPSSQYLSMDPLTASSHMIDSNLCCLIVYNLSPDAKEGSLWQTFGPYGAVHSVSLARDPVSGKCRGFGFVTMPNYHEAFLAAQQLNGNPLDNRLLQIILNPGLKMPTVNQYLLPPVAP